MKTELYYDKKEISDCIIDIKREMFRMLLNGKSGHIGSSLSCIEILVAMHWMKYVENKETHLIFSKGHAELGIYATMKKFNLIQNDNFKEFGSKLQGHPSKRWLTEIEYSAGSLGQGLSYGIGVAIAYPKEAVIILLGDGEMQEGQVWEALIVAGRMKLNNLYIVIDFNEMQLQGKCLFPNNQYKLKTILENLDYKVEICDGHDEMEIYNKLNSKYDSPYVLVAKTIKGHGVSFMENNPSYHSCTLNRKEIENILYEITKGND